MEGLSASAAFWDHLRKLCLDQFPCGVGSWNKSRFPPRRPPHLHGLPAPRQAVLPWRNGVQSPNEETVEVLTEFLRCPDSPWALPPDCSPPEQQLRELAVQSPGIVRNSFLCSYFRSLRIVNKGVTEIDVGLLKFPNLEELILTANQISTIPAANLPPGLKVLELCGNEVQSLKDLCTSPPAGLQHLGLGHNCQLGSSEEQYLADTFWPNLVSLDFSYNNFTNLLSLLSKLLTLNKLRILVLQGNPFALLPGYRGFTVDSLPQISVFDDVIITPDERHNFLNLTSYPELLLHDVKLIVTIGKIRGVPNPVGPEELENSPDSPVITYSYYVTYEFAKGEKKGDKEASKDSEPLAAVNAPSSPFVTVDGETPEPAPGQPSPKPETGNTHSTARKAWAETIDCEYRKEHLTQDLVALKAYLLAGTTVAVVEEKVVSWPVALTPEESPGRKGKGKGEKGKADPGKAEKGKKEKGKAKDTAKDGNKKKKKPFSPELQSDPPIVKVLGPLHVSLEKLLAGASSVETLCDFGVQITELNASPPSPREKENKKGAKKDAKAKSGNDSVNSRKTPSPAKGKGRKKDSPEGTDLLLSQPVPLTVEFQMQHIKWESASHILKTHEASE
ncbi:leucine-rich repeat-containing protein 43 [Python bivittatus]|uniref:Leucine-rich repeat-containing protein 43 n=1 Tax=Python bivittatus TaxID=176946 RepID=A0A9F5MPV1_PYTBI|nr:leucine-rich repeat-containing protein 43 [Python bivittatus]